MSADTPAEHWKKVAAQQRKRAEEWRSIAEYGLDLAMYGENPPGLPQTWRQFEYRMRVRAEHDEIEETP